jgi:DNA-binding Lrp family transcriptional regulator
MIRSEVAVAREVQARITDVRALRALANPVRYRILGHLMSVGAQTASECAAVVAASPSNCSYHLRELARYGLVERVGVAASAADARVGDRRDRPWRPTATGLRYGPPDDEAHEDGGGAGPDPVAAIANRRLIHAGIDDDAALAHAAVDAHDELPTAWRRAELISTFGLLVTADELVGLSAAVDALLRPYIGLTRDEPRADAERVHVIFDAFRRPAGGAAG